MNDELNLLLGGPQGAGLETCMQLLAWALLRSGYGIITNREYHSNIKGRHSYISIRAHAKCKPTALKNRVEVLAAMDPETIFTHYEELGEKGYLLFDLSRSTTSVSTIPSIPPQLKTRIQDKFTQIQRTDSLSDLIDYLHTNRRVTPIGIDFKQVLSPLEKRYQITPQQSSRYVSSILFGALTGLLDLDQQVVSESIITQFNRSQSLVDSNQYLVEYIYDSIQSNHGTPLKLSQPNVDWTECVIGSGNDFVAMGKIMSGMRYQSYYPITPAADESFFIESVRNLKIGDEDVGGILVLQTEDELSAIGSTIGAALTGTRSSTATSGPGYSLMVEGLGWAGMNEVPLVLTYYQRSGPSTGQATRGSQADLLATLFSSHGEFAKIVLSSGDHEEAFYDTIEAFNLAEQFQVPVIHLLDKFLANSITSVSLPDFSKIRVDRGLLTKQPTDSYKRFDASQNVSPRAFLGNQVVMWYSGSEHDEFGLRSEDPLNRQMMQDKRLKKRELIRTSIPEETQVRYYGTHQADFVLVGWGSTKRVACEVLTELQEKEKIGAYLHLKLLDPFPTYYVKSILERFPTDRIITLDHNALAQTSMILKMHTLMDVHQHIVKYTGRPMYLEETVLAVLKILESDCQKVVLMDGA